MGESDFLEFWGLFANQTLEEKGGGKKGKIVERTSEHGIKDQVFTCFGPNDQTRERRRKNRCGKGVGALARKGRAGILSL